MLRRQLHRGRTENRVDARGKHRDRRAPRPEARVIFRVVEFEIDQRAFAAPDPVALHGADFVGPAFQFVQIAQQFVGILRCAYEPLLEFALLDKGVFVTPAAPV